MVDDARVRSASGLPAISLFKVSLVVCDLRHRFVDNTARRLISRTAGGSHYAAHGCAKLRSAQWKGCTDALVRNIRALDPPQCIAYFRHSGYEPL
jgi:hypothetical protein